jgi:hypothetical protein
MDEYKFRWIAIDDILEEKPKEHETCIVCMEVPGEEDWHLQIAHWYDKGARLDIKDSKDKNHTFNIAKSGFYIIQETTAEPKVFLAHGVKFWTILHKPRTKPGDILTIE